MISIQQLKEALFSPFKVHYMQNTSSFPVFGDHGDLQNALCNSCPAIFNTTTALLDTEVQSMLKQTQSNCYRFTVVRKLDLAYHHVSGKEEDPQTSTNNGSVVLWIA